MMSNEESARDYLLVTEKPCLLKIDIGVADGTNIAADTEYIYRQSTTGRTIYLSEHREESGWQSRLERLLAEMRSYRRDALPFSLTLTQDRCPSYLDNGTPCELKKYPPVLAGSGVTVEPAQLFDHSTQDPIEGLFPFLDAMGKELRFSDGGPIGYRLGLSRRFTLFEPPRLVGDDRQTSVGRLKELCTEAGSLLLALPSDALSGIWRAWGNCLCLPTNDLGRWIDAIFEYGWTPGNRTEPWARRVYDPTGYKSLDLHGDGLFPRVPPFPLGDRLWAHSFPTEAAYPFQWSSTIDDVISASIDLVEWTISKRWRAKDQEEHKMFDKPYVFLSYCHDNKSEAKQLYDDLSAAGFEVWRDEESLLPGQDIDDVIDDAIAGCFAFVCCLSAEVEKRDSSGMYPELAKAVEINKRLKPGQSFIYPVRFSSCKIPSVDLGGNKRLNKLLYVDLFGDPSNGVAKLIAALRANPNCP